MHGQYASPGAQREAAAKWSQARLEDAAAANVAKVRRRLANGTLSGSGDRMTSATRELKSRSGPEPRAWTANRLRDRPLTHKGTVSIMPEPRLGDDDVILINSSGGKDSQAMLDKVCTIAAEHGALTASPCCTATSAMSNRSSSSPNCSARSSSCG